MMSIVYITAKLRNDIAVIVVLIVYTRWIMNDFMKAFDMLGRFSSTPFEVYDKNMWKMNNVERTSLRLEAQQVCLIFHTTAATNNNERKQLKN